MAIIRNDRSARQQAETREVEEPEEEIDYRWHPTEDEYVSPLTSEQWAELLGDESFADSDAARAVRCLYEYGEPATFQQLSIRYRGTMGRYRRWLSEAAQAAGERYGLPAPQQDQYGMDEWWPLLYQARTTGKIGAGVFEMMLRPEVTKAFELLAEKERAAKRAENMRNLKRIEQLERARQEERERKAAEAAAEAAAAAVAEEVEALAAQTPEPEPVQQTLPEPAVATTAPQPAPVEAPVPETVPVATESSREYAPSASNAPAVVRVAVAPEPEQGNDLPAVREFLSVVAESPAGGSRFVTGTVSDMPLGPDMAAPVDYALRYAERIRGVLSSMQLGMPRLSAAAVARELGDESVAALQEVLNGQSIPTFEYLDALHEHLLVNLEYLEVPDGIEDTIPTFCALDEMGNADEVVAMLMQGAPTQIAYVVDNAKDRHTGIVVRFSDLCCALLTRCPVSAAAKRSEMHTLDTYMRMVSELDDFARDRGIARTSHTIAASMWEDLIAGRTWPGAVL